MRCGLRLGKCAIALAALGAWSGCVTTSMTAAGSRAPVIVGPVACIGCAPAPDAQGGVAPVNDVASHTGGYVLLPYVGDVGWFGDKPPSIDGYANRAIPDPCQADVRVTKIDASSFGITAFVYGKAEQKIELSGVVVPVAPGRCGAPPAPAPVPGAAGAGPPAPPPPAPAPPPPAIP